MQINCSSKCYILLAFAFLFYFTNNKALSFVCALMFLLFIIREKEGFMTLEPIQSNLVPQTPEKLKENKVKSYVPYTISPYQIGRAHV